MAIFVALYLSPALIILAASKSRGFISDAVFALLWPYFFYRHFKKGV